MKSSKIIGDTELCGGSGGFVHSIVVENVIVSIESEVKYENETYGRYSKTFWCKVPYINKQTNKQALRKKGKC